MTYDALSPYIHPTKLPQMAFIMMFVGNSNEILVLQGEKKNTPDVSSLIGGKVGDRANNLNEIYNPYIALLHEIEEETGAPLNPQCLSHELTLQLPHKNIEHQIHLYSGRIAPEHLTLLDPPLGTIKTVDINTLSDAAIDNDIYLSPMNNALVQLYKENKKQKSSKTAYRHYTPFISLDVFQSYITKKKARLGQHPA